VIEHISNPLSEMALHHTKEISSSQKDALCTKKWDGAQRMPI